MYLFTWKSILILMSKYHQGFNFYAEHKLKLLKIHIQLHEFLWLIVLWKHWLNYFTLALGISYQRWFIPRRSNLMAIPLRFRCPIRRQKGDSAMRREAPFPPPPQLMYLLAPSRLISFITLSFQVPLMKLICPSHLPLMSKALHL